VVKESLRTIVPHFCTRRMLRDYTAQLYVPALQQSLRSARR